MRSILGLTLALLVASTQAGLVHRRHREVASSPADVVVPVVAVKEPELLRTDQIPVHVIQMEADAVPEPEPVVVLPVQVQQATKSAPVETPVVVVEGVDAVDTAKIADEIAVAVGEQVNLRAVDAVIEAVRKNDEQLVQQEIQEAVQEENQELLRAVAAVQEPEEAVVVVPQVPVADEDEEAKPEVKKLADAAPEQVIPVVVIAEQPKEEVPVKQEVEEAVKALPVAPEVVEAVETEAGVAHDVNLAKEPAVAVDEPTSSIRQATQATPTQTSTQQNFVQQLIQNSPIGAFINQLTGGQQPQQQQPTGQVQADETVAPATPAPGFPASAISSAQQAVQNVFNSTTQAFSQLATNLGNTFQSTLSTFGVQTQQQAATGDATTARPPGPLQSIVNTFIGGNAQQAGAAAATTPDQAPQGPLQGILSFFQGGNRPQAAPAPAPAAAAAAVPAKEETPAAPIEGVDDKIDEAKPDGQLQEQESEAANEVRNSAEVVDEAANEIVDEAANEVANEVSEDSFEESQPEELIVVNDDADQPEVATEAP